MRVCTGSMSRRALVQTVDFFTPIVDDPAAYGRIAAANALSDVYAMGGRPLTALAIAGVSQRGRPRGPGGDLQAGGLQSAARGGRRAARRPYRPGPGDQVRLRDHRRGRSGRIWSNAGAQPGDRSFLTKPIGTGVIATAIKFDRAPSTRRRAAMASMMQLNRAAAGRSAALPRRRVHACTDVTGFGLIGHATEMARASGCAVAHRRRCGARFSRAPWNWSRGTRRAADGPTGTISAGESRRRPVDPRPFPAAL